MKEVFMIVVLYLGLTSIANRRRMTSILSNHISLLNRYNKEVSLILIDVDRFKSINDNYGHSGGDAVLAEMANLINRRLREPDWCSRWGG